MRYSELFEGTERVTVWSGETITVLHNPSPKQFQSFAEKHRALRGLIRHDEIWLWSSYSAVHPNLMQELGLPESTDCITYMDGRWGGPVHDEGDKYVPAVERLTPKPKRVYSEKERAEMAELLRALRDFDEGEADHHSLR